MKKKIRFVTKGQRADIGEYKIYRMLPNAHIQAVGPFIFLDHVLPVLHSPGEPARIANGSGAHPHRGIATLTYILRGEADHLDSKGYRAKVRSGGVQWMKAGNGIIRDEVMNVDPETKDFLTHAFQFWINLPAKQKAESPNYLPIQASEVPRKMLTDNSGWIRIIAGEYENLVSKIPAYSKQFLFHIHLDAGKKFSLATENGLEYAAFLPLQKMMINDEEFSEGALIEFDREEGTITFANNSGTAADIIFFGGEKYNEPIVAGGPFVVNSQSEIIQAYRDFHEGKYGEIDYSQDV
jgi:redox-sensitive bicupin YhaK (pirin superfamily)